MKLTVKQLRRIISEVSETERPSVRDELSHLSEVKEIDAQAFDAWVTHLIEDCSDTFTALGDGRIEAVTQDGKTFRWDPESTMGEWEEAGANTPDDQPEVFRGGYSKPRSR